MILATFHPCEHYAQICPAFTHTRTHNRAPAPSLFHVKARASLAISRQYCVRRSPVAPACIQSESFFPFLNEKWKKGAWLCECHSLHPLLVAWARSNLVGSETPALQNAIYCIINGWVSGCEHRPLKLVMIGRLIISSCDSILILFKVD